MDTFIANFKEIIVNRYAQFKGRADKSEFWKYVLVYIFISIAFSLLIGFFDKINLIRVVILILNIIVIGALIVPSIAVSVRRLHDIGKSGGWIFINLIPIIGQIWFIILTIQESEPKINRFDSL